MRVAPSIALMRLLERLAIWLQRLFGAFFSSQNAALRNLPVRVGRFSLLARLGKGGMGEVFMAQDRRLERRVAIKLSAADTPARRRMFDAEARAMARLSHANIATVYERGETADGKVYYAMELIDGVTLQELVERDGPQPAARAIRILAQVADALAAAHAARILHGDVKPSNTMLRRADDSVKLFDFGLATSNQPESETVLPATIMGTPAYMAPEVLAGQKYDERSEVYAVGLLGYWLLTATLPFEGSPRDVCRQHLLALPDSLSDRLGESLPARLEALVLDCLEKRPSARPATMRALLERLASFEHFSWTQDDLTRTWKRFDAAIDGTAPARLERAEALSETVPELVLERLTLPSAREDSAPDPLDTAVVLVRFKRSSGF